MKAPRYALISEPTFVITTDSFPAINTFTKSFHAPPVFHAAVCAVT